MLVMTGLSIFELSPGYIGVNVGPTKDDIQLSESDEKLYYEVDSLLEEREIMKNYPYELDKAIVGVNANLYYIFIVIVVIVLCTDLSNSTAKNTISSSISRKKYYVSKLITCLLLCTAFILINNYGTYFVNLFVNGKSFSSSIGEITKVTLYQLPLIYGIISMLVGICTTVKKTSIFNTITIPFIMVAGLLISGMISLFRINPNIMNYEYQIALQTLANNPTNDFLLKTIVLGFAYIIIFNFIGYYMLKKAEIK